MDLEIDAIGITELLDQDPGIFRKASSLGRVVLPIDVLAEVDGLHRDAATRLGLEVYEPSDSERDAAAALPPNSLSASDRIYLAVAKAKRLVAVTADAQVAIACERLTIVSWRPFRLFVELLNVGAVRPQAVRATVNAIARRNQLYFVADELSRLDAILRRARAPQGKPESDPG